MREKPIIFSGDMIKAILEGRKSMTRRPLKPQPTWCKIACAVSEDEGFWAWQKSPKQFYDSIHSDWRRLCPYGIRGDRLWVRETWFLGNDLEKGPFALYKQEFNGNEIGYEDMKWKPSIHMPRWASRITLEITDVKVERLKEISATDCIKEGMINKPLLHVDVKFQFQQVWNSIYGKDAWDLNPFVWAISFKRIS